MVSCRSCYFADIRLLKEKIADVLRKHGVVEGEVSLALVGERKMRELAERYLGKEELHEVLSFPSNDPARPDDFVLPPESSFLGDIVICYPEARRIAMEQNRMVDEVLLELTEHGTMHLLGEHHRE